MSATNFYSGKISAAENGRGASCGAASNRPLQDFFRSPGEGFKPARRGVLFGVGGLMPGPACGWVETPGNLRSGAIELVSGLRPEPDLRRLKAEDEAGAEGNQ